MRESTQLRILRANNAIISAKIKLLDEDLARENETSTTIASLKPVQFNPSVHSSSQAAAAIRETSATIDDIYETEFKQGQNPISLNNSCPTWFRLQRALHNQPNCLLWSTIRAIQDGSLAKIKSMFKDSSRQKHFVKDSSREFFDLYLVKSRAKHLSIELKRLSVVHELELTYEQFIGPYEDFLNRVYSDKDLDSDLVEEYLTELTTHYYNRGQLEYLTAEIDNREKEFSERSTQLHTHTLIMSELQTIYDEECRLFNETRDESAAFYSIKQKLQTLESNAKGLVLEARQTSNRAFVKPSGGGGRLLNSSAAFGSGGGGDSSSGSFNLSINGVLSSTRLDAWPNENSMLMMRYI